MNQLPAVVHCGEIIIGDMRQVALAQIAAFGKRALLHVLEYFGADSNYPPAKPGALECWPLKAAVQVAYATCEV